MNFLKLTFLSFGLLVMEACNPCAKYSVEPSNSGQVNYVRAAGDGTITLVSTGRAGGKKKPYDRYAVQDAKANAFKVLLFRGVPGSPLNSAMIGNENKARSEHGDYLNELIEQGGSARFVTESHLLRYSPSKCDGVAEVELTINYQALKTDMLQNKVVPKYGIN